MNPDIWLLLLYGLIFIYLYRLGRVFLSKCSKNKADKLAQKYIKTFTKELENNSHKVTYDSCVQFEGHGIINGHYHPKDKEIYINPCNNKSTQLAVLLHELGHKIQHDQGFDGRNHKQIETVQDLKEWIRSEVAAWMLADKVFKDTGIDPRLRASFDKTRADSLESLCVRTVQFLENKEIAKQNNNC